MKVLVVAFVVNAFALTAAAGGDGDDVFSWRCCYYYYKIKLTSKRKIFNTE